MSALSSKLSGAPRSENEYLTMLTELFRRSGWKAKREPSIGDKVADLLISRGNQRYIIELKAASEGRPDRLVPLLSQAILQARAYAQAFPEPAAPLAVVAAPVISPSAANSLISFLSQFAPDVAVGILDREGFRHLRRARASKNSMPHLPRRAHRQQPAPPESAYLFSDLSQWMLKVLLAPLLPEDLLQRAAGKLSQRFGACRRG